MSPRQSLLPSPVAVYTTSPEDRSFPAVIDADGRHEFVGQLEPNYWCRGWNSKRGKYCKARAGAKTDHPGVGRCTNHGGASQAVSTTHGRYSRIQRVKLKDLIEELENDPDPLDLFPELATARALFIDWIDRYDEFTGALLAWYTYDEDADEEDEGRPAGPRKILDIADGYRLLDNIRRVVATIEKISAENAISRPELLRVMTEMGRVVESVVKDPDQLEKIKGGWGGIRIGA